jgi:hypothetical protein
MSGRFTDVEGTRKRIEEITRRRQSEGITATCELQGNCLVYKTHFYTTAQIGGQRGTIKDFSPAARLRMLKDFHRIDFSLRESPLFVTLTYPDDCAYTSLAKRNLHRKMFARRLEAIVGRHVPAAWRIEWTIRQSGFWSGCPVAHWHLLIFRIGFIPYAEINRAWKETIGYDGYVRTDIKRVDERGAIQGYMAKYISKDAIPSSLVIAAYQNRLGRAYGWLRKKEIPFHPLIRQRALTDAHRAAITGFAAEKLPHVSAHLETSFTLLGDNAKEARQNFPTLALTEGEVDG